ncbi:hypothetical protein ACS0TY_003804 [Phlomoides rotata]
MLSKGQMSRHNIHVSEPNEPTREGRYWGYQDLDSKRRRTIKADEGNRYRASAFPSSWRFESEERRNHTSSVVVDHSDPFSTNDLLTELESGKFASVTKEIEELLWWRMKFLASFYMITPELQSAFVDDGESDAAKSLVPEAQLSHHSGLVVIIDSDDENDAGSENHKSPYLGVELKQPSVNLLMKDKPSGNFLMKDFLEGKIGQAPSSREADSDIACETEVEKDKGEYVGTDDEMQDENDELSDANADGLDDIWNEMKVALECSKVTTEDALLDEYNALDEEECEHSFIFKDDIGDICCICGVIKRGIETIIEYNFSKSTRTTRSYRYEGRTTRELDQTEILPDGIKLSDSDFTGAEIHPHPRHRKEMKPHQVEGFNFLLSNLVTDNPGGCIMAHAPGSGKTFMIISFLQSFMAKYPAARPLVVQEFIRWQVEDLPLYDFY